ncbi:ATP-binding protein [Actinomadura scrupuli]|uniref:ATP-binding protein n=1 Tax=Actinomadura scrupuli TaxID=559629 RepID=UPI003D9825B0
MSPNCNEPLSWPGSGGELGWSWALPRDATCAGLARTLVADKLAAVRLPLERIRDAEVIASELSTNAYRHAGQYGPHELWLYPHLVGGELVCGVFDGSPVARLPATEASEHDLCATSGRGLAIVHELSGGRWGVQVTRSRLGTAVPGKLVWFGLESPHMPAQWSRRPLDSAQAGRTLRARLQSRGVAPVYLSHRWDMSVVSLPYGLTVWCRDGRFRWRHGQTAPAVHPVDDLAALVERLVGRFEELRRSV